MKLVIRVTAADLENWRFVAEDNGFSLSAMIRHAVELYIENPPGDEDLSDLKMSKIIQLFKLGGQKIDRAWLRELTRCDKTIGLRLPRSQLQRWQIAAAREDRYIIYGLAHYQGRPVSAMVRRAVRRYAWNATSIYRFLDQLVAEFAAEEEAGDEDEEEGDEGDVEKGVAGSS